MKRVPLLLFTFAAILAGQNYLNPTTVVDITGDGSVHAIAATGSAQSITFYAPSANASNVRIGDANISTSRGTVIVAGGSAYLPFNPGTGRYSFAAWYYLVQSGDKLSINYIP